MCKFTRFFSKHVFCSYLLLFLSFLSFFSLRAVIQDNRFFQLINRPILSRPETCRFFRGEFRYLFSDSSYDSEGDRKENSGLYDFYGPYNQTALIKAQKKVVLNSRKRLDLRSHRKNRESVEWRVSGSLDVFSFLFDWFYKFSPCFEIGGSIPILKARSRLEFELIKNETALDPFDLAENNAELLKLNGTEKLLWDETGFGNLNLYVRFGRIKEFFLRSRWIDFGAKLGVIFPTGKCRDLDAPGSFPLGNGGHWGLYGDFALDAELKEDFFAGFNFEFIHHFSKTKKERVPLLDEPANFGVVKGKMKVSPGLTFNFSPYLAVKGLRSGFGAQLAYNLSIHRDDIFLDRRPKSEKDALPINLECRKGWSSEHIICTGIYDFGVDKECRGHSPQVFLDVDVPISFLRTKNVTRNYGVCLRVEVDL